MIFSSLLFIYAFLPLSLGIYYLTPKKWGNTVLLILSIVFCAMFGIGTLALTVLLALINYLFGLACSKTSKCRPLSAILMGIGIISDLAVFLLFKTDVFSSSFSVNKIHDMIIPVGISFVILSCIGYLIDIFRGKLKAEYNFLNFVLYITFFPKFYMGPLINYATFRRKLINRSKGIKEIGAGLTIFVKGLAKKVLLADNLFRLYSAVRTIEVGKLSALSAWLGILGYSLCIYFTLSGFSDMGVGISRCFGFRFPRSFNYPCFSMGINDFCSRWHITAVKWFRCHVLPEKAEDKKTKIIWSVLFILSWGMLGLWYDFSINTMLWGIVIGTAAQFERLISNKKMLKATAVIYTFIVTSLCWVLFFGENLTYSLRYSLALVGGNNNIADSLSFYLLKMYLVILLVGVYASTDLFRNLFERSKKKILRGFVGFLSPVYTSLLLLICTSLISYTGVSEMMLPIL